MEIVKQDEHSAIVEITDYELGSKTFEEVIRRRLLPGATMEIEYPVFHDTLRGLHQMKLKLGVVAQR